MRCRLILRENPWLPYFWWLVGAEFALAALGALAGRTIGYFDSLLADRFTLHVSLMVMKHASRLDLASYEDPLFHDKLERARVQATDRIAMIQAIGSVGQQLIAAVSLAVGILWFSPWLLVVLVVAVVPAFLGESHFAFLGYAQNIRQTPDRRRLDYLRLLGASKESAKELRLFALSDFLSGEYAQISRRIYEQNVSLARRRLWAGAALSLVSTAGYYGAYAYVIYRTVTGELTWGSLQFLAGAIAGASTQHSKRIFYILEHCRSGVVSHRPGRVPAGRSKDSLQAGRAARAASHPERFRLRRRVVFLSAQPPPHPGSPGLPVGAGRERRAHRRERRGQDHAGKATNQVV